MKLWNPRSEFPRTGLMRSSCASHIGSTQPLSPSRVGAGLGRRLRGAVARREGDPMTLPANLPAPVDDGAADPLRNSRVPDVSLPHGRPRGFSGAMDRGRFVVYAYPRTGRPGESPLVDDWDLILGARGCTPETCGFCDHHAGGRSRAVRASQVQHPKICSKIADSF
jgi:hypothetical protein